MKRRIFFCSRHSSWLFCKISMLLICLCCAVTYTDAQRVSEESLYGKGSYKNTLPYNDEDGYSGTKTEIRDGKGTKREERIEATKTESDGLGGTDIYKIESYSKFDCNRNVIYSKIIITKNGQEIKYEDAVYEPPKTKNEFINKVSGFKRTTDKFGNVTKEKWDAKQKRWVEAEVSPSTDQSFSSIEPSSNICFTGRTQSIFFGPSFHRESYDGEGVNLFGGTIGYAKGITENLEAVAHGSVHFDKDDDVKTRKTFAYVGVNFFPFAEASPDDNVALYAYGRAGMAFYSDKFEVNGNSYKNSESSFSWIGGAGARFNVGDNLGIFIQGDYGTSRLFDNPQNNIRVSGGIILRKIRTANIRANQSQRGVL